MTRLPAVRMLPNVGQVSVSAGVVVNEGTNARLASPESLKFLSQTLTSIPSGLVNNIVTTTNQLKQRMKLRSPGLLKIQSLTSDKYEESGPASSLL